jgi:hypothetical protein
VKAAVGLNFNVSYPQFHVLAQNWHLRIRTKYPLKNYKNYMIKSFAGLGFY